MAKDKHRITFIGGRNAGRRVVEFLNKREENLTHLFVEGTGVKGSGFVAFDDLLLPGQELRKVERINNHAEEIKEANPNLTIVAGCSEIIGKEILESSKYGTIGFHYAPLPDRKGCNPVMWTLIHGLTESGVTAFYYNNGIDTGDIVEIERFPVTLEDDSASLLEKCETSVLKLLDKHLDRLLEGTASRVPQIGPGIYTPRRSYEDGKIYWTRTTARDVYNLVRALRPPYMGAYSEFGSPKDKNRDRIYILKVGLTDKVIDSQIINWKTSSPEQVQEMIKGEGAYSLTGNGAVKLLETRIGEI